MLRHSVAILCVATCGCGTNDDVTTAGGEDCNHFGWDATVLDDGGATLDIHTCLSDQCFDASTPIQRSKPLKEIPDYQHPRAVFWPTAQPGRFEHPGGCIDTSGNGPASACVSIRLTDIVFPLRDGDVALLSVQNVSGDEVLNASAVVDYRVVDFGDGRGACQRQTLFVDLDGVVVQGSTDPGPTSPR